MRPTTHFPYFPPPSILGSMTTIATPATRYVPPTINTTTTTSGIISAASSSSTNTSTTNTNGHTTVYIGNVAPHITNEALKRLLEACGPVAKLNRAEYSANKAAGFGFVDFETPAGTYRALKMLNEAQIADKTIIINCQDKVKDAITVWRAQHIQVLCKAVLGKTKLSAEVDLAEEDKNIKLKVEEEISKLNEEHKKYLSELPNQDEEKKDDTQTGTHANTQTNTHTNTSSSSNLTQNVQNSSNSENKTRNTNKRSSVNSRNTSSQSPPRKERITYLSRDYRPHWREREREKDLKMREIEAERSYQKREKEWEREEEHILRELDSKKEVLQAKISPEIFQKLIDNDLRGKVPSSCSNSHRWSEWKKRRIEEMEFDKNDILEEKEEKLRKEEEEKRKEEEAKLQAKMEDTETHVEAKEDKGEEGEEEEGGDNNTQQKEGHNINNNNIHTHIHTNNQTKTNITINNKNDNNGTSKQKSELTGAEAVLKSALEIGLEAKSSTFQPIRISQPNITLSTAFDSSLEEEEEVYRKHKPLTRLDEHRDQTNQIQHAGECIKVIEDSKRILAMVPSEKKALFEYPVDWEVIKKEDIIEAKLRPWVKKKVNEYMGAGDELVEVINYIITQITQQPNPYTLLEDLERFLDVEAEGFMRNMWRMLIYAQLRIQNK